MKNLYVAAIVTAVLIGVVTVVEGVYLKDRWGEPGVEAAELGKRFAQVPKKIGNWTGVDMPVEKQVQERSGAVSFVNRDYKNSVTNQSVTLWLIVGHSRDIIRHTPDICYPSAGFRPSSEKIKYDVNYGIDQKGKFYTSKYQKEDSMVRQSLRVFWAWNHPDTKKWEAPDKARYHFTMVEPALYKLYFTSQVTADEETVGDNVATEFASLMLPEIDAALFPELHGSTSETAESDTTADETAEVSEEAADLEESADTEADESDDGLGL